jgi:hypothetical protein
MEVDEKLTWNPKLMDNVLWSNGIYVRPTMNSNFINFFTLL